MRTRISLSAVVIALIGLVIFLIIIVGAFAGGVVLTPYLADRVQAAPASPLAPVAQPMMRLPAPENDVLAAYEQALNDIYEAALPSVVNIQVAQKIEPQTGNTPYNFYNNPFGFGMPFPQTPEEFYRRGQGSGFVWDTEGHIVTNYHVVEDAADVEVIFADGKTVKAEVVGTDRDADLAVIKVDRPAAELQPVTLGDSDKLRVGQIVIAIGNPFGQEFTMTSGIVSAVGRTIRSGNSPFSIPEVIQTDAAINPGNSGGPLLNRQGEVIGINTMIISRSGANAGVGFAVPINIARRVVPTLIKGETYEYAWLGISGATLTSEVADFMKLPSDTKGALVVEVAQDSPADEAGLQGSDKILKVAGQEYQLGGDVIVGINDRPIETMDDLIAYLTDETQPGDRVKLDLIRPNGERETVEVTLKARPGTGEVTQENK
ncbi:MAG: trypsin-like peptidase domain-containing protein [Anaerolineae bacterium]